MVRLGRTLPAPTARGRRRRYVSATFFLQRIRGDGTGLGAFQVVQPLLCTCEDSAKTRINLSVPDALLRPQLRGTHPDSMGWHWLCCPRLWCCSRYHQIGGEKSRMRQP